MKSKNYAGRSVILILLAGLTLFLASCGKNSGPELKNCSIIHETEFGGIYIQKTIDEFNALGFSYGDSVDIRFSNGYQLEDQPYYNGYYTENGESLLVAYPGYPYIRAGINNGDDLWVISGAAEDDTATITLKEKGKYLDIQEARDIHYTDLRKDYPSDEAFANFRSVSAGDIAPDTLYRSASPCDNQHARVPYVNALIEEAGVQCILDLADTDEKILNYIASEDFQGDYFLSLYENGQVIPFALNTNFTAEPFRTKLADGLTAMTEQDGPYLVHCTEGKDRTGFLCLLLEALCGADYQEIVDDYMITYDNYYRITETKDPARYNVIVEHVLDPMVRLLAEPDADLKTADLSAGAVQYLKDCGLDDAVIGKIKDKLTK